MTMIVPTMTMIGLVMPVIRQIMTMQTDNTYADDEAVHVDDRVDRQ